MKYSILVSGLLVFASIAQARIRCDAIADMLVQKYKLGTSVKQLNPGVSARKYNLADLRNSIEVADRSIHKMEPTAKQKAKIVELNDRIYDAEVRLRKTEQKFLEDLSEYQHARYLGISYQRKYEGDQILTPDQVAVDRAQSELTAYIAKEGLFMNPDIGKVQPKIAGEMRDAVRNSILRRDAHNLFIAFEPRGEKDVGIIIGAEKSFGTKKAIETLDAERDQVWELLRVESQLKRILEDKKIQGYNNKEVAEKLKKTQDTLRLKATPEQLEKAREFYFENEKSPQIAIKMENGIVSTVSAQSNYTSFKCKFGDLESINNQPVDEYIERWCIGKSAEAFPCSVIVSKPTTKSSNPPASQK